MNNDTPTKCIVYSGFLVGSNFVSHKLLRQIYDLADNLGCRLGSLSYRTETALNSATKPYIRR